LGVALLDEALELRSAGIESPILAWLATPGDAWSECVAADIDLSASAVWALREIAEAARQEDRVARVHLKIDTGLGRSGSSVADWPAVIDEALTLRAEGSIDVVGIWSHLAYADEPNHPTVKKQADVFDEALDYAASRGITPPYRHLANTAATLNSPQVHYDLVRPGIGVYGLSPGPASGRAEELGLTPVMTLTGRFASVKRVPAGHGVSYGHEYITERETTLGLVPLGYADGIPRRATNVGPVLAAGRRRIIAGRVCMDQFVIELGDDPAEPGDEVVLFGSAAHGEPTAEDWARACDTIGYEIVTRIGPRVKRVYEGEN
jgi:alanine racemase